MLPKVVTWLLLGLLGSVQLSPVAPSPLTIDPQLSHIPPDLNTVTFTCSTDEPLAGCQFRWLDNYGSAGPVLDLSSGHQIVDAYSAHLSEEVIDYSYHGQGLDKGECGLSMKVQGNKRWMVACRVHAAAKSGGWKYAWADLHARNKSLLVTTMTPKEVHLLPGEELKIVTKAKGSQLSRCNFFLPSISLKIGFKEGESTESTSNIPYKYLGEGLKNGDCGISLPNVTEADSGHALFWISSSASNSEYSRFVAIVVARPPSEPAMRVVYDGDNVTARCVVQGGLPAANLTWYLGDAIIRQDTIDDSRPDWQDAWQWPWTQVSTMQEVSFRLESAQDGATLKCMVSHVALKEPLEVSQTISLKDPTVASCHNEEAMALLLKVAKANAAISELAEEAAKVSFEKAKESLKVSKAQAAQFEADARNAQLSLEAAKANVQTQQTKATDAEEELAFERERRSKGIARDHSGRSGRHSMVNYESYDTHIEPKIPREETV